MVLCRPADVRNVGGAIRAVANSGVGEIRVVTTKRFDQRDLLCYSSGATDHLEAQVFSSVAEAVADCKIGLTVSVKVSWVGILNLLEACHYACDSGGA